MRRQLALFSVLMLCSACATSPEPNYYDLTPVKGATASDASLILKVRRPSIAAYLDRPDIVRQKGDFQVLIDEQNRWAEPPDAMVERILTEDLRTRFPNATVYSETDDQSHDARFILETNIDQFNDVEGRGTIFKGALVLKDKLNAVTLTSQSFTLEGQNASSLTDLASNLSDLVGRLADMAAGDVQYGLTADNPKSRH